MAQEASGERQEEFSQTGKWGLEKMTINATGTSKRKPHSNFAGYRAELRNIYSGGHTIILDCKRAADNGTALVENFVEEGGRYQVLCNQHSYIAHVDSMRLARIIMKDPTYFCSECRILAGESTRESEGLQYDHK